MPADDRRRAEDIFRSVLKSVDPYDLVKSQMGRILSFIKDGQYRSLVIVSFGKAAYLMAKAAADCASDVLAGGVVITKYGHAGKEFLPGNIRVFEAGHPVPDENGVLATGAAVAMLRERASPETLVLCLISGGGSALLVAPFNGICLEDKQTVTRLLLGAGAEIQELNAVRKHLSRVKGGRLAEIARPSPIISLILSDVIGDHLDVIASGPTSPDRSSFRDALAIIDKYHLRERMPAKPLEVILKGVKGEVPDTPKEGYPMFRCVDNRIIGSNRKALETAENEARGKGFQAQVVTSELRGEARNVGKWLGRKAIETCNSLDPPMRKCLIAGGETTVTVRGSGLGGRNTELALAFAREIRGAKGITLLTAGTDGTDGPTDAAGAIVDGQSIEKGRRAGLDPDACLDDNDSYNFFKQSGDLLITGPTGTNVMDILLVLINPFPSK